MFNFIHILCFCAAICLCVAFADFAISNHPQHVMGGMSNLSAVALAAQLSAAAGANFTGAFPNYHGAVVSGNTTSSGKLNIQQVWGSLSYHKSYKLEECYNIL